MIITWILICLVGLIIGILSIKFSYYPPLVSEMWIKNFRIIKNVDHVGPILELIWIFLLEILLFIVSVLIFPDQLHKFLNIYWKSSWFILIFISMVAIIFFNNLVMGHPRISKKIERNYPDFEKELEKKGSLKKETKRLRVLSLIYSFSTIIVSASILIAFVLIISGESINFQKLSDIKSQLLSSGFSDAKVSLSADTNYHMKQLVLLFSKYYHEMYFIISQTLGVLFLISFTFMIYLSTNWQEVCIPSGIRIQRYLSIFLLFIVIPGTIIFFLNNFFVTSNFIYSELNKVFEPSSYFFAKMSEVDIGERFNNLNTFLYIKENFSDQYSFGKFWIKILSSWGGILFIFQIVFSFIQKKIGIISFFSKLFPKGLKDNKYLKAIFIDLNDNKIDKE